METHEEKKEAIAKAPKNGNDRAMIALSKAKNSKELALLLMGM